MLTLGILISAPPKPPGTPPRSNTFDGDDGEPSYAVRAIDVRTMVSLLTSWDTTYRERDRSSSEVTHALHWPNSSVPRACFGLLRAGSVRALVQVEFNATLPLRLRGVACAPDEMSAASLLVETALDSGNFTVDWEAMRNQPRWYVAMKMYA